MVHKAFVVVATLLVSTSGAFLPSRQLIARGTTLFENEKPTGHEVRPSGGTVPDLTKEETERIQQQAQEFMEYQQEAPKLDWPTEVRTLVQVSFKMRDNDNIRR